MSDDRTAEFLSLAQSLPQERLQARPASISSAVSGTASGASTNTLASNASGRYSGGNAAASSSPGYQELRAFHKNAAAISSDIASTSALLSELTKLVRSNSLFQDDSNRVTVLVMRIKQSIESLNQRLDETNTTLQRQKYKFGSKHSQANQEASNISSQLQQEFAETTTSFKQVLQQRSTLMKATTDKQKQVYGVESSIGGDTDYAAVQLTHKPPVYGSAIGGGGGSMIGGGMGQNNFPTLDLTSGMATGEPTSSSSQLPRPHGIADYGASPELRLRRSQSDAMPVYSGSTSSYNSNPSPYSASAAPLTPLDLQRMEQEHAVQLIPDQSYLRERADAMETVESNIVELGTIFNKLAVMVSEHRDMVQRVDDNVQETSTNMEMSMQVLTDTLSSLRTNKALFMKVFSVIVLFVIMFIIFFA